MAVVEQTAEFSIPQAYRTDKSGPIKWIFSHAIRQWHLELLALVGAIGNAALTSLAPILIGKAFNAILANPPQVNSLGTLAILIGASQLIRAVLQFARNSSFEIVAQRVEKNIRNELYVNLLGKSMTFHSLQSVGDTMARATNDVREVNFLFSPGINLVVGSFIFLLVPIFVAPTYHYSLVLTPVVFLILYIIALKKYLRTLAPVTGEVRASFGDLNSRLTEALDGIETVKGASQEQAEIALFRKNATRYRSAIVKEGDVEARFIPMLLFSIATAMGLLHALLLYRMGLLDVGGVIGYFGILLMLDFPTFISLFAYSQISLGVSGARRILELMKQENNLDQNLHGKSSEINGEIEFRNVSFSYGNNDSSLQEISFKVKPGQTVAIVGQTGSGKTSLVKLINRTYDTNKGQVLIDGVDVRDWNLESLRRQISMIEQDVFLFSRSIRDNIAFGRPDAKVEEIERAAQEAQAEEFISQIEGNYDSVVGERGVTLSGGQRQRLALARAFLTDPKILILDDSTSAIDSATEDRIQRAIYAAAQGRTTFIITHRLSQIRWADLIIVMRKGRVSAIGKHEELLVNSEAYRRVFGR